MNIILNFKHTFARFLTLVFATLMLAACGGGGGGGGGEDNPPAAPIGDVSGQWRITETGKDHNCSSDPGLKSYSLNVAQNGNSITVTNSFGERFSGTLDGSTLGWSGSYDEDAPDGTEGRITLKKMSSTVEAGCDSLSGSADWTWTATEGAAYSCSGTTRFTGSRTPALGCGDNAGGSGGGSGATLETTLVASADNLLIISTDYGDNAYSDARNAVGCMWNSPDTGCFASLIAFDIGSLSGKTIKSAVLSLYVDYVDGESGLPGNTETQYQVQAINESWDSSVTPNTMPSVYGDVNIDFNPPSEFTPSVKIDVTSIVSNWASGSWSNNGFMLIYTNGDYQPGGSLDQATAFCSLENCERGSGYAPSLFVEYE